jgi:hypothetical protein
MQPISCAVEVTLLRNCHEVAQQAHVDHDSGILRNPLPIIPQRYDALTALIFE